MSDPSSEAPAQTPNPDLGAMRWDQIKHDDLLFTYRASFFLLADTMLLAAFMVQVSAQAPRMNLLLPMCVTGWVVSVIWMWTTYRHIVARNHFYAEAKQTGVPYSDLQTHELPRPGAHELMGICLPLILGGVWLWLCLQAWGWVALTVCHCS